MEFFPFPKKRRMARRGFTLLELLVVVSIVVAFAAVVSPVLGVMIATSRLNDSEARIKGVVTQLQNRILDRTGTPDYNNGLPRIPGASYQGMAVVVRWDSRRGDYYICLASHTQSAKDPSGNYLANQDPAVDKRGYSPVADMEPFSLGAGIRIAGIRRNDAMPDQLELIPDCFVVPIDARGNMTPTCERVFVNLQDAPAVPPTSGPMPWNEWNVSGLYAGEDIRDQATPEGFLTSMPVAILYHEKDMAGVDLKGKDPNFLLRATKCRVVVFPLLGGKPLDI